MQFSLTKLLKNTGFILLILGVIITFCNIYINRYSNKYIYSKTELLPKNDYGLILGTNKFLIGGGVNKYFEGRIQSAVKLIKHNKIKKIIVSGYKEKQILQ